MLRILSGPPWICPIRYDEQCWILSVDAAVCVRSRVRFAFDRLSSLQSFEVELDLA